MAYGKAPSGTAKPGMGAYGSTGGSAYPSGMANKKDKSKKSKPRSK